MEIIVAGHLFFSQDYEKSLEPNLRLGAKMSALFDLNSALKFTERAEIYAEKTGDKRMITAALKQRELVLEAMLRSEEAVDAYKRSLEGEIRRGVAGGGFE